MPNNSASRRSSRKAAQFDQSDPANLTPTDRYFRQHAGAYFDRCHGTSLDRLNAFARFVPRQALSVFLARERLFELVLPVHGAIIECGIFTGAGLFSWLQLSAIHEPYNHNRRVVGFDTFAGLSDPHAQDRAAKRGRMIHSRRGSYAFGYKQELLEGLELYDANRPLGHLPRAVLVEGDACQTIPRFVTENPHSVVALLYLDFDLYEPTKVALEQFVPRMVKGSVVAFDELNQAAWPGETRAVMETLGLRALRVRRFPFTPNISYAVLD